MIKEFTVMVASRVTVEIDTSKFTEEFMQDFRDCMHDFYDIDDHVEHLAALEAIGYIPATYLVEGYGHIGDMGIKLKSTVSAIEIESVEDIK